MQLDYAAAADDNDGDNGDEDDDDDDDDDDVDDDDDDDDGDEGENDDSDDDGVHRAFFPGQRISVLIKMCNRSVGLMQLSGLNCRYAIGQVNF